MEIRDNIDKGQNAGEFRVRDAGTLPGEVMQPLAAYTIKKRREKGLMHDDPLKETGATYRSIGLRSSTATRVVVGSKTSRGRQILRKQLGTGLTGIPSTDLREEIPPRNPIGYSRSTVAEIRDRWLSALAANKNSSVKIEVHV